MIPYDKCRARYENDAMYRSVVDALKVLILNLEMSPSEVRETAIFACILVEERRMPKPYTREELEAMGWKGNAK